MRRPPTQITKLLARQIKVALWGEAASQIVLAKRFGVSQGTVSAISLGYLMPQVPWPDGSSGAINPGQRRKAWASREIAQDGPSNTRNKIKQKVAEAEQQEVEGRYEEIFKPPKHTKK